MLAKASGRPILPVGIATSRYLELNNWDRSAINLPFSRGAFVLGELIHVPGSADDAVLETYRQRTEAALNAAHKRAYAIVGAPDYYSSPPLADQTMAIPSRARFAPARVRAVGEPVEIVGTTPRN
jgi:hypothetical protein